MFLIRFIFYFALSFAILCIPVGDGNHLFDKFYGMVTPYANQAVRLTKQKMSTTKRYSKKLYSNSEPIENDQVKLKLAGVQKKIRTLKNQTPDDSYTDEERARLKKVLSND
jgi:hypothetical protein